MLFQKRNFIRIEKKIAQFPHLLKLVGPFSFLSHLSFLKAQLTNPLTTTSFAAMLLAIHKRSSPASNREDSKDRLRISGFVNNFRFSFESKKLSPDRSPFLSSSTSLTPSSQPYLTRHGDDSFLTALDVHENDDNDANYLLSDHVGLIFGDEVLPPPPPRKSTSSSFRLRFNSKSECMEGTDYLELKKSSSTGCIRSCKEICFICHDTLDSKMDTERILTLECGDRIHSDCMDVNVECALDYAIEVGLLKQKQSIQKLKGLIFPVCEGKRCKDEFKSSVASPIDEEYVSRILTNASLKIKLSAVNPDLGFAELSMEQPPVKTKNLKSQFWALGDGSRESKYFVKDNATLRTRIDKPNQSFSGSVSYNAFEMRPPSTRASYASASTGLEPDNEKISLEQLKSYFLQHFVNIHPRVDMVFLMSLGPVRLVDKLNVAIDDASFYSNTVYLFADFIAIINENLHPMLFPLNEGYTLSSPETSVFQFDFKDTKIPSLKLQSDEDAIIEKWGIVVSDKMLIIPAEFFTSTIPTSLLKYTSFKPSLADMGLNIVGTSVPKKEISPIYEMDLESVTEVYLPVRSSTCGSFNLEKEMLKFGLLGSPFPSKSSQESDPIYPLRIRKKHFDVTGDTYQSDLDVDSDEELINLHRTPPT